jgi:hypothetical protein
MRLRAYYRSFSCVYAAYVLYRVKPPLSPCSCLIFVTMIPANCFWRKNRAPLHRMCTLNLKLFWLRAAVHQHTMPVACTWNNATEKRGNRSIFTPDLNTARRNLTTSARAAACHHDEMAWFETVVSAPKFALKRYMYTYSTLWPRQT